MKLVLAPEETPADRWMKLLAIAVIAFWSFQCGKKEGQRHNYTELRLKPMRDLYEHVQNWNE